jgi:hypothetical protein
MRSREELRKAYEEQIAEAIGKFEDRVLSAEEEVLNQPWLAELEDDEVTSLQDVLLEQMQLFKDMHIFEGSLASKLNVTEMLNEIDRQIGSIQVFLEGWDGSGDNPSSEIQSLRYMEDWLKLYFEDHNIPY